MAWDQEVPQKLPVAETNGDDDDRRSVVEMMMMRRRSIVVDTRRGVLSVIVAAVIGSIDLWCRWNDYSREEAATIKQSSPLISTVSTLNVALRHIDVLIPP